MSEEKNAINISINLDEIYTGDEYGETIARIIKDEIEYYIKSEVKKIMKKDKELKKFISDYKSKVVTKIIDGMAK